MDAILERIPTSSEAFLERVRALQGPIREAAPEIEAARQLPPRLAELLHEAGVFAAALPRSWGGPEFDPVTISRTVELLAQADASAAWAGMIGMDTGFVSASLEDGAARALFKDPTRATAFVANPTGTALRVEGGYRVTGRWTFASGCTHAAVYAFGTIVTGEQGPNIMSSGMPELRTVVLPAEQAQVVDTWTTTGLRGSGSHDVALADVFVPEANTFAALGRPPRREGSLYQYPLLFTLKLGAVAIGIARGAIDDVIEMAASKRKLGSAVAIRDEEWLHTEIGRAEIAVGQARAFYYEALDALWQEIIATGTPSRITQARAQAAQVGAWERCTPVVDAMYRAGGSSAIYSRGTLDRRLRDIHAMGQHITLHSDNVRQLGREFLGHPGKTMLVL